MHEQWFDRTAAKDLDGLMEHIAPDIVSYEHRGTDAIRRHRRRPRGVPARARCSPGPIDFDIPDLTIHVSDNLAVTWGLDRIVADGVESRSRGTRVFERRDGEWQMIHQHLSVPLQDDQRT